MFRYMTGDLLKSSAHVLVNPVNTVGVMGKGLAKQFKEQYPQMFKEYKALCSEGRFTIGSLWLYKDSPKWVLNFPTKKHWKNPSQLEFIEAGLKQFTETYEALEIQSIAFPQLGCGLGGLDWQSQVKPLMESYLSPLAIEIQIYLPEKS